jgi:hypothetical protein
MLIVDESVLLLHLFDKLIWQISAASPADGGHMMVSTAGLSFFEGRSLFTFSF